MDIEKPSEKPIERERISQREPPVHSLEFRNRFQRVVFAMLGIGEDIDQVMKASKVISEYIDNPDNTEVRELISQKKFDEAAKIMIEVIRKEKEKDESWPKAA